MPLPSEVAYWQKVSEQAYVNTKDKTAVYDNIWKRPHQIKRLLKYNWIGEKVLEIGVGNGVVAGILKALTGAHMSFAGTELSENFRRWAKQLFSVDNIIEADVRELPGGEYTRIIALDSLEHVRPEHRDEGYKKISSVAAKGCLLFIHLSRSESFHDKEFDHPFGLPDFVMLENEGFRMESYESYICDNPMGPLDYSFVVMRKL